MGSCFARDQDEEIQCLDPEENSHFRERKRGKLGGQTEEKIWKKKATGKEHTSARKEHPVQDTRLSSNANVQGKENSAD